MSDYASAADHARRVGASIARLERRAGEAPDDRALQINLAAKRKLLRRARQELEGIAESHGVELCDYRLIPRQEARLLLPNISSSLLQYQYVFSQVYDSLLNGPKRNARIADKPWKESCLEIGFTYSGSFGTVLMAPSKRDFFEGSFDRTVEAVDQLLNISDDHDVRDVAKTLGEAVIKRLHDWSFANVKGNFDADVRWRRSDGRQFGRLVKFDDMARMVTLISATSDEDRQPVEASGVLIGADLQSRSFHFVVPNGDTYRGSLGERFPTGAVLKLPGSYRASITRIVTINYASGRETERFELEQLSTE
ncbi:MULTISPECIES: hypothetical protein [Sphingomonas]|uniref:Uncharacterized protein n=1 Tax=Sphingomonas molluscorum TaxID=418184 RepID=A0ABU8Q776_9SPHN|nr:hypothetical protein [Sphingomonas sp. JUb134]MBM7406932.1 hypothetical protein [Sphingomonas sp. JUb134]